MDIPLLTSRVTDLTSLKVQCTPEVLIDSANTKVTNFGSCFAVHSSVQFNDVGLSSYYSGKNCFHYTTSSLRQVLEFCLLDQWQADEWIGWCDNKQAYFSLAHRFICDPDKNKVIALMEHAKQELITALAGSSLCIITIGTATYQRHNKTGKVVCHGNGLPESEYELLSESLVDIQDNILAISDGLQRLCNGEVKLILTISPQRYAWSFRYSDNLNNESFYTQLQSEENWLLYNNLDKSKIRVALFEAINLSPYKGLRYFPSFDIVMDELKTYENMNHDTNDHMHVDERTAKFVINRFFNTFSSERFKEYLQFNRSLFHINHKDVKKKFNSLHQTDKTSWLENLFEQAFTFVESVDAYYMLHRLYSVFEFCPELEGSAIKDKVIGFLKDFNALRKYQLIDVAQKVGSETVAIYGLGVNFESVYNELRGKVKYIIDAQYEKHSSVYGIDVVPPSRIGDIDFDKLFICSEGSYESIKKSLLSQSISPDKIA